jgi:hypothetical protein
VEDFVKQILGLAGAVMFVLTGCSTNRRLLAPDHTARHMISPEASAAKHNSWVDPLGNALGDFPQTHWQSYHQGVVYRHDFQAWKAPMDVDLDQVAAH